ncbi:hypothetical protein M408DRAFT_24398 [Serendipita vermifera MAFF 305830]|uniref:SART-1 protein n=1 Tax=Serendipita vermifera MAFF 305830 TaxID=933852 RepID=A0A0C3ASA9_SERVB|nr:hypothetical protein M408DRAFT_24398 [Serendipita vermifera MAFF 305830]
MSDILEKVVPTNESNKGDAMPLDWLPTEKNYEFAGALRDKIAKVRNRRELNAKLTSYLGDVGDDNGDTLAWVKKSKKREKELAKKRQQEIEEMDKQSQQTYDEKDLAGIKIGHDLDGLPYPRQRRTRAYTGYDDDEFQEGHAGMRRKVLAKYDENIDGPQETGFRIGLNIDCPTRREELATLKSVNTTLLTIDYAKNLDASDYLQEGDIGFKKPKKKKKQANRRVTESEVAAESQDNDTMQIDNGPSVNLETNFVDDDELQAALARSRKAKMMKIPKLTPEEIARRIAEERETEALIAMKVEEEVGFVIDDTSEFVQAVSLDAKPERRVITLQTVKQEESEDEEMEEPEDGEVDPKMKEEMMALKMELDKQFGDEEPVKREDDEDVQVGTAAEKTHSTGLAGTLNILRSQGALQATSGDLRDRERTQRQQDPWLAGQRARAAFPTRICQPTKRAAKAFENYKPDVNIVYHDEFGREMTPKEAWKALSHRFHGKGSGKMKTEKRLKKIAEEKKMQAMISGQVCTGRLVCGSSCQWGIVACTRRKQDRPQPEEESGR